MADLLTGEGSECGSKVTSADSICAPYFNDVQSVRLKKALDAGWSRVFVYRNCVKNYKIADIHYVTPDGKRIESLKKFLEILNESNPCNLSESNFSLSQKVIGHPNETVKRAKRITDISNEDYMDELTGRIFKKRTKRPCDMAETSERDFQIAYDQECRSPTEVDEGDISNEDTEINNGIQMDFGEPDSSEVSLPAAALFHHEQRLDLQVALDSGWQRVFVYRYTVKIGGKKADIHYVTPDKKRVYSMKKVLQSLSEYNPWNLSEINFSFGQKLVNHPNEIVKAANPFKNVLDFSFPVEDICLGGNDEQLVLEEAVDSDEPINVKIEVEEEPKEPRKKRKKIFDEKSICGKRTTDDEGVHQQDTHFFKPTPQFDEEQKINFKKPLDAGWTRVFIYRRVQTRGRFANVHYLTPNGERVDKMLHILHALETCNPNQLKDIHFSLSPKLIGHPNEIVKLASQPRVRSLINVRNKKPATIAKPVPSFGEQELFLLREALDAGWYRLFVYRRKKGGNTADVHYVTPDGESVRSMKNIVRYLKHSNPFNLTEKNFSMSQKLISHPNEIVKIASSTHYCEPTSTDNFVSFHDFIPGPSQALTPQGDKTDPDICNLNTKRKCDDDVEDGGDICEPNRSTTGVLDEAHCSYVPPCATEISKIINSINESPGNAKKMCRKTIASASENVSIEATFASKKIGAIFNSNTESDIPRKARKTINKRKGDVDKS